MALLVVSSLFAALLLSARVLAVESQALIQRRPTLTDYSTAQRYGLPPIEDTTPDLSQDHNLLDIVLVSSVDGRFHALNRTSGHVLWSMSSFATPTSLSAPSSLSPLVRTTHAKYDPDYLDDDGEDGQHETYIIEPQSGDIYVLHSPSSPLQRFPFSMAELVDVSPFTSINGEDTKVFVGRKETSLLLIELETGKIKATLNAECPFIPDEYQDTPIDLDELEGSKPPTSAPTEVYIGRTDYIISIHKKPKPGRPAPPAQELSFSTYGPNNKDNHLQAIYRRTPDDTYIQPLANGEVVAFRARTESSKEAEANGALWGQHFSAPIVAVFDVLQARTSPHQVAPHPFVLLQPRPRLQDLFPSNIDGSRLPDAILRNMGSAFVGLVDGTESLFAMSPDRYPLIVFGGGERHGLPAGEDSYNDVQEHSRPDEHHEPDLDHCLDNPYDPRCLIGVRVLDDGDGLEGRMRRLLDGPKTQKIADQQPMGGNTRPQQPQQQPFVVGVGRQSWNAGATEEGDNLSDPGLLGIEGSSHSSMRSKFLGSIGPGSGSAVGGGIGGMWEAVIVTLVFGAFTIWMAWSKLKAKLQKKEREGRKEQESNTTAVQDKDQNKSAVEPLQVGDKAVSVGVEKEPSTPKAPSSPLPSVDDIPTPTMKKEPPPSLPLPTTPRTLSFDLPTPGLETPTPGVGDEGDDLSDGDGDAGNSAIPGKRRNRRGRRGKKKKPGALAGTPNGDGPEKDDREEGEVDASKDEEKKPPSLVLTSTSSKPPPIHQPSLVVSDTILGFGSHGTVVFQGSLQGRAVAVKRLLQDFVTLAAREVSILQESDDHPNVIRYYYQESHGNFLYIALELCPASLADIVENPDREQWRDIAINFDPKKALKQITSGLRHLHALKLVHRDIKPQNILVSSAKASTAGGFGGGSRGGGYRMLISDFGLCKKLDVDQTSFLPTAHGAMGAGTVGWRAPEILGGKVKLDEPSPGDESSLSSRGSVATINGNNASVGSSGSASSASTPNRLTKSVDIFALGCLFYYTLTNGGHPYGDRFEREVNIMKDCKDLSGLERFGEEGTEAKNLISAMLSFEPPLRPDTTTCLLHPFFWDPGRRLNFLQDASDRFEIMCRDPKDAHLLTLERDALSVVGNDWHVRLDKIFIENLGKYRKYDGKSVQDLLRALRNKKHHYQDLPDNVKRHLGPMPEGFLGYFTRRYPQLFLHVHGVIKETGLYSESMFRTYFELPDS